MREILFRGKRKDNDKWTFGNLEVLNCKLFHIVPFEVNIHTSGIPENVYYDVIPSSVGQYTGLTDKNGKKIFEGDIISNSPFLDFFVEYSEEDAEYCANFGDSIGSLHTYFDPKRTTVIGNIHDNPELLEVTK